LKDHYPEAQLHLLFLSKHSGYATESLIKEHHLLASAHFLTLREKSPQEAKAKKTPMGELLAKTLQIATEHEIDLMIDFEMHGLRGAWLTWQLQRALFKMGRALGTVGVGQFGFKKFFYDQSSPSLRQFAKSRGLSLPMDYTNRDFVALSALGIQREARPIELKSSASSRDAIQRLLLNFEAKREERAPSSPRILLGLNIGCGTEDALYKRPLKDDLVAAMVSLYRSQPFDLILTGAPFEKEINDVFIKAFEGALHQVPMNWSSLAEEHMRVTHHDFLYFDAAGKTSLPELSALIERCDLVVSTDSGPYHMAVALKVPTLVWFVKEEVASYHEEAWCRHVINPSPADFVALSQSLLK
jgi:ADP-heptose:LPS heptosyltransferase